MSVQDVGSYFLTRKKTIDRYVEGEHKWFGDVETSTLVDSLSMYPSPKPWYLLDTNVSLEPTMVSID